MESHLVNAYHISRFRSIGKVMGGSKSESSSESSCTHTSPNYQTERTRRWLRNKPNLNESQSSTDDESSSDENHDNSISYQNQGTENVSLDNDKEIIEESCPQLNESVGSLIEGHDYEVIAVYTVNPNVDLIEQSSDEEVETEHEFDDNVDHYSINNEEQNTYKDSTSEKCPNMDIHLEAPVVTSINEYLTTNTKQKEPSKVISTISDVGEYFVKAKEQKIENTQNDEFFAKPTYIKDSTFSYDDEFLFSSKIPEKLPDKIFENEESDKNTSMELNNHEMNVEVVKRYLMDEIPFTIFKSIQKSYSNPQSLMGNNKNMDDTKSCLSLDDLDISDLTFNRELNITNKNCDNAHVLTEDDINSFLNTDTKCFPIGDNLTHQDMDIDKPVESLIIPVLKSTDKEFLSRNMTSTPIPNVIDICTDKPKWTGNTAKAKIEGDDFVDVVSCNDSAIPVIEANNVNSLLELFEATEQLNTKPKNETVIVKGHNVKSHGKGILMNGMRQQDAGIHLNKNKMRQILMSKPTKTVTRRSPSPPHSDHDYCSSPKKRISLPNLRGGQSLLKPEVLSSNSRILSSRHRSCKNKKIVYNESDDESEKNDSKNKKIKRNRKKLSPQHSAVNSNSNCVNKSNISAFCDIDKDTFSVSNDIGSHKISDVGKNKNSLGLSNNPVIQVDAVKASDSDSHNSSIKLTIKNKSQVIVKCDEQDSQKLKYYENSGNSIQRKICTKTTHSSDIQELDSTVANKPTVLSSSNYMENKYSSQTTNSSLKSNDPSIVRTKHSPKVKPDENLEAPASLTGKTHTSKSEERTKSHLEKKNLQHASSVEMKKSKTCEKTKSSSRDSKYNSKAVVTKHSSKKDNGENKKSKHTNEKCTEKSDAHKKPNVVVESPKENSLQTTTNKSKQVAQIPPRILNVEKTSFEEDLNRAIMIEMEKPQKKKKLNLQEYKMRKGLPSSNTSSTTVSPESVFPDMPIPFNLEKNKCTESTNQSPGSLKTTEQMLKTDEQIKVTCPIKEASRKIIEHHMKQRAKALKKRDEEFMIPKVEKLELQPLMSDAELLQVAYANMQCSPMEAVNVNTKPQTPLRYEEKIYVSTSTNTEMNHIKIIDSGHIIQQNVSNPVIMNKHKPVDNIRSSESKLNKDRYKDIEATLKRVGKHVDTKVASNSLFASIQDVVMKKAPGEDTQKKHYRRKSSSPVRKEPRQHKRTEIIREYDSTAVHGEDKVILYLEKDRRKPKQSHVSVQTDTLPERLSPFPSSQSRVRRKRNDSDMSMSSDDEPYRNHSASIKTQETSSCSRSESRPIKRSLSKGKRSYSKDRYDRRRRRSPSISYRQRKRTWTRSRSRSRSRYSRYRRSDSPYKSHRRLRSPYKRRSPSIRSEHRPLRSRTPEQSASTYTAQPRARSPPPKKLKLSPPEVQAPAKAPMESSTPPLRRPTVSESSSKSSSRSSSSSTPFSSSSPSNSSSSSAHSQRSSASYKKKEVAYPKKPVARSYNQNDRENNTPVEERRIVFVGRLSKECTKMKLRSQFSKFGSIIDVRLHSKEDGSRYGFVTFQRPRDAWNAVEAAPSFPQYDVGFGGRRAFCRQSYADLDGIEAKYTESAFHGQASLPRRDEGMTFEQMLSEMKEKINKNKEKKSNYKA